MKRILITGLSGTGKSTLTEALAARGYKAVDADSDDFSHWAAADAYAESAGTPVEPDRDWVWREDRIQELLSSEDADLLFVSGCAPNMRQFMKQFNLVVLLSAPADLLVERLASRTNNQYGKRPEEVARVLSLSETVEPLLRRAAGYEIDTSVPLDEVVRQLLQIIDGNGYEL